MVLRDRTILISIFLGIYLLVSLDIHAQGQVVMLKKAVDSIPLFKDSDTNKVKLLRRIALRYNDINLEKARYYLQWAKNLSLQNHYNAGLIEAYDRLGNVCQDAGEFDSAIFYQLKSLEMRESRNDYKGLAGSYGNLSSIYIRLKDSAHAIKCLNKELQYGIKGIDNEAIGKSYENFGLFYMTYQKYALAYQNFDTALKLFKTTGNKKQEADIYTNIGITHYYQGETNAALTYFRMATALYARSNDYASLTDVYNNIGGLYQSINLDSSLFYLNKALALAQKTGATNSKLNIYNNIYSDYRHKNDFRKADEYSILYWTLKDSLFNVQKAKVINELQTKYDVEKDHEKITSLTDEKKQEALLRNAITAGLGGALIFLIVVYRQRNRVRKEKVNVERERARSEELLLNILPEEVAAELKEKGKAEAKYFDNVTVLFTDFVNFTQGSERMTPKVLIGELDTCFKEFDNIIIKHHCEKIKTVGDAYLAVCGLPGANATHAQNIVSAAIEIRDFMVNRFKQIGENTFEIRLGVHSGSVVAGIVGVKKFQYDIWGDTVNTAARMEQLGEPGMVNISGTTYALVKDKFNCVHRGKIQAKGKGEIDMYFVEG